MSQMQGNQTQLNRDKPVNLQEFVTLLKIIKISMETQPNRSKQLLKTVTGTNRLVVMDKGNRIRSRERNLQSKNGHKIVSLEKPQGKSNKILTLLHHMQTALYQHNTLNSRYNNSSNNSNQLK